MPAYKKRGAIKRAPDGHPMDDDNHMPQGPVRKVVYIGTKNTTTLFVSRKCPHTLASESVHELDFARVHEVDYSVIRIAPQPDRLPVYIDGKEHSYVPDFLITYRDGSQSFAEVKTDEDFKRPQVQALIAAARETCRQLNVGFIEAKTSWIRREPRFGNVGMILRYRGLLPSTDFIANVMSVLAAGPAPLKVLYEGSNEPQAFGKAYALLAEEKIVADLDKPLTEDSLVWFPEGEVHQ